MQTTTFMTENGALLPGTKFSEMLDAVRNAPVEQKTRVFSGNAVMLFTHENFAVNKAAKTTLEKAIMADPTKFSNSALRLYLGKYYAPDIAKLYLDRCLCLDPVKRVEKNSQESWAVKSALAVKAVLYDRAKTDQDKENAKGVMRVFCSRILGAFGNNIHPELRQLIKLVEKSGMLIEKNNPFALEVQSISAPARKPKYPKKKKGIPAEKYVSHEEGLTIMLDPWKAGLQNVKGFLDAAKQGNPDLVSANHA